MPLPFDLRMRLENPEEDWICFWKFWRLVKSGYYGRSRSSGEGWSQARSSEFSRTAAGLEVVEARVPRREPPVSQCSPTYSLSPLTGIELAWRQFSSVQFSSPPERLVRAVQVADVLPRCCPAARNNLFSLYRITLHREGRRPLHRTQHLRYLHRDGGEIRTPNRNHVHQP